MFETTYNEAKDKELKKGLDLEGGFSAVLELNISELVSNLAGNKDGEFNRVIERAKELQITSEEDFVTLFGSAWNEIQPDKQMISNFHSQDRKDVFPIDLNDNEKLIDVLRDQAEAAIDNAENIIRARIDKYGVVQPTIQKQSFSGRILVELPGVSDKERFRDLIVAEANLEFWKTYRRQAYSQQIASVNNELVKRQSANLNIDPDATWDKNDPSSFTVNPVSGDTSYVSATANNIDGNYLFGTLIKPTSLGNINDEGEQGFSGCVWGFVDEADRKEVIKLLQDPEIIGLLEPSGKIKFAFSNTINADGRTALNALR